MQARSEDERLTQMLPLSHWRLILSIKLACAKQSSLILPSVPAKWSCYKEDMSNYTLYYLIANINTDDSKRQRLSMAWQHSLLLVFIDSHCLFAIEDRVGLA